jgi:hypothetical protein
MNASNRSFEDQLQTLNGGGEWYDRVTLKRRGRLNPVELVRHTCALGGVSGGQVPFATVEMIEQVR